MDEAQRLREGFGVSVNTEKIGENITVYTDSHPPRTDSPEYLASRRQLMTTQRGACLICGGVPDLSHPEMTPVGSSVGQQDHHGGGIVVKDVLVALNLFPIEWSQGWGSSPATLSKLVSNLNIIMGLLGEEPYSATISDIPSLMAYVDSTFNANIKLCLTPDTPVLMADGREQPIAEVCVGDWVIGHDGRSHRVTGAWSKPWNGPVAVVDGVAMTPGHEVLTPGGWLPASTLQPGIPLLQPLVSEMVRMARIEPKVLQPVVAGVSVDVVDALGRGQASPDGALHHQAVLHDDAFHAVLPHPDATVACAADRLQAVGVGVSLGPSIQPCQPLSVADRRLSARLGARSEVLRVARADQVRSAADLTRLAHSPSDAAKPAVRTQWRPVREVRQIGFRGYVHDLTVAGSHSFMVGGPRPFAVHNCAPHHVGLQTQHTPDANGHEACGIHEIPAPIFWGQLTCDWDRFDMWLGTTGTVAGAPHPSGDGSVVVLHAHPSAVVSRGDVLPPTHPHARAGNAGFPKP